jgi:hypothetical protein
MGKGMPALQVMFEEQMLMLTLAGNSANLLESERSLASQYILLK